MYMCAHMTRTKQRVNINLQPQLVIKARNSGLNISKITENALNRTIQNLEQNRDLAGPAGIEPTTTGYLLLIKSFIAK